MLSVVKIWVEERSWEKILSYRIQMGMSRGKTRKEERKCGGAEFWNNLHKIVNMCFQNYWSN
jgi:hypothetical protein